METHPISQGFNRSYSDSIVDYNANSEIVCCFYTLVIRVDALDEKYPGGHLAFLLNHQGWSNEDLLAVFHMGPERQKVIKDLKQCGLVEVVDWIHLDEDDVSWSWNMFNFETKASWLKGRYKKGNIFVRYTGDGTENLG
jgi:hypothetical protein